MTPIGATDHVEFLGVQSERIAHTCELRSDRVIHAGGVGVSRSRRMPSNSSSFNLLLGIEMKREHYEAGGRFCDFVAEQTDEATLARMWDSPEAMPWALARDA